ncbi:MAG TPA: NAD-dependent epimerase/dehydratase family protein [Candidatus Paceibacterota bacterium]
MKLILVTGGAGFIGSHLCERLVKDGHRVISLDNYFTGSRESHIEGVEYREGHTKNIAKLIPETPDIVFHLGEYSRVAKSIEEPQMVFDLNMAGTFGVLEFWRAKKCKLVYAGSSTKFESADIAPYTWGKAANSELIANYAAWYGLSYVITYFYNVYGPGERAGVNSYGTVIETFRQNYLQGKPHEVRGTGEQTRAFTHVEDTVNGILIAAEKGTNDEYAICAKETYSLLEVAHAFGGEVSFLPPTPTTRSSGTMDVSKLEALGWKQQHTLEEYIQEIKNASL